MHNDNIRRHYEASGFAIGINVLSVEDLNEVRSLLDPLFNRLDDLPKSIVSDLAGRGAAWQIPEINGTARIEPKLLSTAAFAKCRSLAQFALGTQIKSFGDHAIYKLPHCPFETNWHQDQAYTGHRVSMGNVSIWIPLQPVTAKTGCMKFIPGSHRWRVRPHRHVAGDPAAHALELIEIDSASAVSCELDAGSVTLHHVNTAHSTGPNDSDDVRRAWILSFSPYRRFGLRHLTVIGARYVTKIGARR